MTNDSNDKPDNLDGNPQTGKGYRPTFGCVLALVGIPLLLVALLMPALQRPREPVRRPQCKTNLKQFGIALHNYHDTYRVFPPAYTVDSAGRPLHSWRTLLLPHLDEQALYDQIDLTKPWNDPANAKAYESVPDFYRCPSAVMPDNYTTYMVIVSPGSLFGVAKSKTIKEIRDGTSNTLMVIDIGAEHAVHWMEPRDADEQMVLGFRTDNQLQHQGGIQAVLADGAVRFISARIPTETLKALITIDDGKITGDF